MDHTLQLKDWEIEEQEVAVYLQYSIWIFEILKIHAGSDDKLWIRNSA